MAEKDKTIWFVEPNDSFTSEVIQKELDKKTDRVNDTIKIPCAENPVWEVPNYEFIESLRESKRKGMYPFGYLDFKTHNRVGEIYKPYRLQDDEVRKASRKRMVDTKKAHQSSGPKRAGV